MPWYLPDGLPTAVRNWWLDRERKLAKTIKEHDIDLVKEVLKKHCPTLYRSIMREGLRKSEELIIERLNRKIEFADVKNKEGLENIDAIKIECMTTGFEFWSKFKREVEQLNQFEDGGD